MNRVLTIVIGALIMLAIATLVLVALPYRELQDEARAVQAPHAHERRQIAADAGVDVQPQVVPGGELAELLDWIYQSIRPARRRPSALPVTRRWAVELILWQARKC